MVILKLSSRPRMFRGGAESLGHPRPYRREARGLLLPPSQESRVSKAALWVVLLRRAVVEREQAPL
eukprot:2746561-Lingulodinium_polyedra.AAC.1